MITSELDGGFRKGSMVAALSAGLLFLASGAQAQFCFDEFLVNDDPLLQCADTDYFIDTIEPGFDSETFSGNSTGRHSASFEGSDLFSDPEVDMPPNLLSPFFSSATLDITGPVSSATSFEANHRGSVGMTARETDFQSAAYQTRSRITFMPINLVDPLAPITISLDISFDFELMDPLENATSGAALAGFGVSFIGADADELDEPEFDVSALAELDTDSIDDLEFFGFDDPELDDATVDIDFEPEGPEFDDTVDVDISIDLDLDLDDFDLDIDEPIVMELDTFGSIFTDGFESGDVAAWGAGSPDTFTVNISSNDPNVRFLIIPEPSGAALLLAGVISLTLVRRRS